MRWVCLVVPAALALAGPHARAGEAGPLELPVLTPQVFSPSVFAPSVFARPSVAPPVSVPPVLAPSVAAPSVAASSCLAHGPGFAAVGSSGTCVRVSGRVRAEVGTPRAVAGPDAARSPFGASGRLSVDARVPTAYGPARGFLRLHAGD
ncbi:MAG: hypothetical protein PGN34_19485 [Methylobacterium frigidaeris]